MYDLMPILTKWVDYLDSASTLTNRPSETDLLLITGSKGRRRLIPMYLKRGKPNFMVVPKGRKTRLFFVSCFSFSFNLFGNVWSLYAMLGYIDCCCNLHLLLIFLFLCTVIDFKVIQFFFSRFCRWRHWNFIVFIHAWQFTVSTHGRGSFDLYSRHNDRRGELLTKTLTKSA